MYVSAQKKNLLNQSYQISTLTKSIQPFNHTQHMFNWVAIGISSTKSNVPTPPNYTASVHIFSRIGWAVFDHRSFAGLCVQKFS